MTSCDVVRDLLRTLANLMPCWLEHSRCVRMNTGEGKGWKVASKRVFIHRVRVYRLVSTCASLAQPFATADVDRIAPCSTVDSIWLSRSFENVMTSVLIRDFRKGHLSSIVTSFCHPANRLLGPCKSTKIICDQTNEGQPEDFIFTSSALTLLRAVSVQHPTCALFTDACEGMEPTVGCGYTYMVTFAGRLLLRGNNLLQQRVRYQVLCDSLLLAKETCLEMLKVLRIRTAGLPGLGSSRIGETGSMYLNLAKAVSNRSACKTVDHTELITLVARAARLFIGKNVNPVHGHLPTFSLKSLKDRISVVTIAGPRFEESSVNYSVLIPVPDTSRSFLVPLHLGHVKDGANLVLQGVIVVDGHCDMVSRQPQGGDSVINVYKDMCDVDFKKLLRQGGSQYETELMAAVERLSSLQVQLVCVCNAVASKAFSSACERFGIIVLSQITLVDSHKIAQLVGEHLAVLNSIKAVECSSIGYEPISIKFLREGWVDPADAVFCAPRVKRRVDHGQMVSYIQFQRAPQTSDSSAGSMSSTTSLLPITLVLCHSVYALCKDLEETFWNLLYRVLHALFSGCVLPGNGLTEMVLEYVLQTIDDRTPDPVKNMICRCVGEELRNQILQVIENSGELNNFSSALDVYEERYRRVESYWKTWNISSLSGVKSLVSIAETPGFVLPTWTATKAASAEGDYDCYIAKVHGLSKAFDCAIMALGCDVVISNS